MCEWAVAFGLGLKLTTGHFGARDGRPRGSAIATQDDSTIPIAPEAEVVDLNQAVLGAGAGAITAAGAEAKKSTAAAAASAGEAAHA